MVLANGNTTQKYILYKEVLGIDINSPPMLDLQSHILQLKEVQKLLKTQNNDGWFGYGLHGGGGFDGIVGRLKDLGVEAYHPFMQKAKQALLLDKNPFLQIAEARAGWPPVENFCQPRAFVLASLFIGDDDDRLLLKFQDHLIDKFVAARKIESLDEISRELTAKRFTQTAGWKWHPDTEARVYKKDWSDSFPCVSDIFVLSACLNWKNSRTAELINESIRHVASFAPVPILFGQGNVRPVATYEMLDYSIDCSHIQAQAGWWLRDYYCLCKVCDAAQIYHYYQQVERLAELTAGNSLIDYLSEKALRAIETCYGYSGAWKSEIQKMTDIYFRVLLILHLAEIDF